MRSKAVEKVVYLLIENHRHSMYVAPSPFPSSDHDSTPHAVAANATRREDDNALEDQSGGHNVLTAKVYKKSLLEFFHEKLQWMLYTLMTRKRTQTHRAMRTILVAHSAKLLSASLVSKFDQPW